MASSDIPSRSVVESLVRETLFRQMGQAVPSEPAPVLMVNSSARHMHISPENVEVLFGKGAELTIREVLYQEGQYASQQTVTLVGPRKRIIPNLRISAPAGISPRSSCHSPMRCSSGSMCRCVSGDIEGTPGAYIMGPKGFLEMKNGVIRRAARPHVAIRRRIL